MKFISREVQYPGKRKIIKVDEHNKPIQSEVPFYANIIRSEGEISVEGTPVSAENLNLGNWRDDDSLSFKKRSDDDLPDAKAAETQIITKSNGETWIVPPLGLGTAKPLSATSMDVQKMIDDAITGAIGGSY